MSERPQRPSIETAAYDPLDLHIQALGASSRSTWSKVSSQTALLLVTGIVLGPQGLVVLTPNVLALLQPAVPVALAVLGAAVMFGADESPGRGRRARLMPMAAIVATALAMAIAQQTPLTDALATAVQAAVLAMLIAAAGWLLLPKGAGETERRVCSVATLLLLGGAADYLAVSALLLGLIAAGAWRAAGEPTLADVRLDVAYLQHPVTALLLVTAGARVQFGAPIVTVAAALVAAAFAARAALARQPIHRRVNGWRLPLTPTAFAVALAMDAARHDDGIASMSLSIIVLAGGALGILTARITRDAA